MPWTGATKFVGRAKELQHLHQLLQEKNYVAIAAIAGMGGVGKTELALQYAITHQENYQGGICWCGVKSGDVGLQMVQFSRIHLKLNPLEDLDLIAQVKYCWQHWREGEVLLVLDDVTKYKKIKPYLPPPSSRFKVLITTRNHFGQIQQLSLDVLQPEAALELLEKLIGDERVDVELSDATSLCEWLGYLPLGLELVGRYLARKQDLCIAEMLRRLEKNRLEERSLSHSEDDMTAQLGVQAAFELSWQELNNTDKQLACLLSLFASAPIPWELLEKCLPDVDAYKLEESRDDKLLNLHLLQRKEKGIYQLHPLLREFFQAKLEAPSFNESWGNLKQGFATAMIAVAKNIPQTPTLAQITAVSPAIPHLVEVAKNLIQYVSDKDLIGVFAGNARFYNGQGLYDKAEPWYKQCLEVTKKRLGEEHLDVAVSLNNLALLYNSQGRYAEAEPLCQQALELRQRLLGDEDPDVATSLNNLALLYKSQGRYAEAEPLCQQALELRRRLLGDEHPNTATSLNDLALLYYFQGRYAEAEPLYKQALELKQRLVGDEHPSVATILNNMALLYYFQGRYAEAEPLYLQAIEIDQRILGKEHPNLATDLHNLALVYRDQELYIEAEQLFLQALKLKQHLLSDEHPLLADTIYALGYMYKVQGRYGEAEPLSIKALELDKRLLGDNHPLFAKSLNNLAELYTSQARYTEAAPLYKQALKIFEQRLGVNHHHTVMVRENLANLCAQLASEQ